jgi:hypothetical protein
MMSGGINELSRRRRWAVREWLQLAAVPNRNERLLRRRQNTEYVVFGADAQKCELTLGLRRRLSQ